MLSIIFISFCLALMSFYIKSLRSKWLPLLAMPMVHILQFRDLKSTDWRSCFKLKMELRLAMRCSKQILLRPTIIGVHRLMKIRSFIFLYFESKINKYNYKKSLIIKSNGFLSTNNIFRISLGHHELIVLKEHWLVITSIHTHVISAYLTFVFWFLN